MRATGLPASYDRPYTSSAELQHLSGPAGRHSHARTRCIGHREARTPRGACCLPSSRHTPALHRSTGGRGAHVRARMRTEMTDPSRVRPRWATSIPAVRSLSLWPRAAFPKRAWCVPHSGLGAAGALPRALASFAQSARMARAQCPLFVSKNCRLLACILVLEPCIARDVRACAKVAAHRHTQISWSSQRAQPVHWRSHVFYTPL